MCQAPKQRSQGTKSGDLVFAEEHGAEEASVNGGLVHHHTVLLVVPAVAEDGHYGIVPGRQLPASTACFLPEILTMGPALAAMASTASQMRCRLPSQLLGRQIYQLGRDSAGAYSTLEDWSFFSGSF